MRIQFARHEEPTTNSSTASDLMRKRFVYLLLLALKAFSRTFYRFEWHWVGTPPAGHRWQPFRLVAILNHTSLFEVLLAGGPHNRFMKRLAYCGVVPVAEKTMQRPIAGRLFSLVAGNVVPISRDRDETWQHVLRSIDPDSMVVILPEGRMKRADGKDGEGKEMTVRGGIADIIETIDEGQMLLAYSEGLHHIQVPGQRLPRLFKTIRLRLEAVDIAAYRQALSGGEVSFRKAVIRDLTLRRDRYCSADFDTASALPEFAGRQRLPGA